MDQQVTVRTKNKYMHGSVQQPFSMNFSAWQLTYDLIVPIDDVKIFFTSVHSFLTLRHHSATDTATLNSGCRQTIMLPKTVKSL